MTLGGPGGGWGSGGGWGPAEGERQQGQMRPPDVGDGDDQPTGAPPPRLSPMPIGSLFEVSARIVRRYAAPLLAVSALAQFPSSLVDAAAQQRLGHALAPVVVGLDSETPRLLTPTPAQSQAIVEALLVVAGTSILGTLLGAIATLAFTTAVLGDYEGRPTTVGGMVRVALRRALPALGAALLAALALLGVIVGAVVLAVTALTLLPAPGGDAGGSGAFLAILVAVAALVLAMVVIVRLALPAAVLAAEPGGVLRAFRRSWHLTGGNTWRSFAVLATVAIALTIVGSTLLELLASIVTDGFAAGMGLADLSDALLSGLVSTLLAPVGGVVLAVLYLDLRVRRDGWQPAAEAVGPAT